MCSRRRLGKDRHTDVPNPNLCDLCPQWNGKSVYTSSFLRTASLITPSPQGLYLAVDLGGTNFRVCSIQLHGNTTFSLTQSKVAIPRALMTAPTAPSSPNKSKLS